MKYQPKGRPRGSSSDDGNNHITRTFSLVCFWGSHNWYIGVVCLSIYISLCLYFFVKNKFQLAWLVMDTVLVLEIAKYSVHLV